MQENIIFFDGNISQFVIKLGQMVFSDDIMVIVRNDVSLTDELVNLLYLWVDGLIPISIVFEN